MEYLERPKSPCSKDCPYRSPFCRLDCEEYVEYEEKYRQYNEKKMKHIKKNGEYTQYRKELDKQFKRRRMRHG